MVHLESECPQCWIFQSRPRGSAGWLQSSLSLDFPVAASRPKGLRAEAQGGHPGHTQAQQREDRAGSWHHHIPSHPRSVDIYWSDTVTALFRVQEFRNSEGFRLSSSKAAWVRLGSECFGSAARKSRYDSGTVNRVRPPVRFPRCAEG